MSERDKGAEEGRGFSGKKLAASLTVAAAAAGVAGPKAVDFVDHNVLGNPTEAEQHQEKLAEGLAEKYVKQAQTPGEKMHVYDGYVTIFDRGYSPILAAPDARAKNLSDTPAALVFGKDMNGMPIEGPLTLDRPFVVEGQDGKQYYMAVSVNDKSETQPLFVEVDNRDSITNGQMAFAVSKQNEAEDTASRRGNIRPVTIAESPWHDTDNTAPYYSYGKLADSQGSGPAELGQITNLDINPAESASS